MTRHRALALTLVGLLAAAQLGAQPALGRAEAPRGSAGIGDPYFPLDGNGGIDVLRYDIHNRYRFDARRLTGQTELRLRATQSLSGFGLDFLLPVKSVRVDGTPVDFDQGQRHELTIDAALDAGQVADVTVRYDGRPGAYAYDGERNWLADRGEVVAMNQPHMAPWWFPANDHPLDKAAMRVSITVPKGKQVVAGGRLVGRTVRGRLATTTWFAKEPMAPYLAFFAAGHFDVARGASHGRPWYSAVSRQLDPPFRARAMRLMKRTPSLLRWVERQVGRYPFSTTGGLTTGLSPGFALENQTRPTYPYMGEGPGAVSTVVHELAHQWFGDSVAVDGWRDIWLNEGAATFMEVRYRETHGGQAAEDWLRLGYRGAGPDFWAHEVADPCPDLTGCAGSIFASWVYERGAMTLQALRNVVGEEAFWRVLRRWVDDQAGGNGSTAEFEALAEEVSGRDLDAFFDAWLHTPRRPADTVANGLG